jgi:hypothetical protein
MNAPVSQFEFETRSLLAALQFIDSVTGMPVECRVKVKGEALRILEKPNGQVLILALDDEADPLAAPANHVIECLPLDVGFLPRNMTIMLPRKNDGTSNSIFAPIKIPLYPSTSYRCSGNLGGLLITVKEPPNKLIRGAMVTLTPDNNSALMTRSISNAVGEALLIVKGAAVVQYAAGTHSEEINATLEIRCDADLNKRITNSHEAIAAARNEHFVIDPDALLAINTPVLISTPVNFKAGRIQTMSLP